MKLRSKVKQEKEFVIWSVEFIATRKRFTEGESVSTGTADTAGFPSFVLPVLLSYVT